MLRIDQALGFVVVVLAVLVLGVIAYGSIVGWETPAPVEAPKLSADANADFTSQLVENLNKLNPETCSASCYAGEAYDTLVSYQKNH